MAARSLSDSKIRIETLVTRNDVSKLCVIDTAPFCKMAKGKHGRHGGASVDRPFNLVGSDPQKVWIAALGKTGADIALRGPRHSYFDFTGGE